MNRYLVFAGYLYYPMGGWNDFIGSFATHEECMACLKGRFGWDWAHVVDTHGDPGIENVYSTEDFNEA